MSRTDTPPKQNITTSFEVGGKRVENGGRPYVIAEAGSNYNQDLDTAYRLIDTAKASGADAVKFQLFRPESLYPRGTKEFDAVSAVMLDPDWVPLFADHARQQEITFLASAFDVVSVDVLEDVGVLAHKVGSSEATNIPVLARMAASGKPIFLATGMCDMIDVQEAVAVCVALGNQQIALMQCGSMYPLPPELTNLKVMDLYREIFAGPVGFSDHSLGLAVPVAAAGRGAAVIEKHFTLDRTSEGPDHFYAIEPDELTQLVSMIHEAHASVGDAVKEMLPDERAYGRREGLYAARNMKEGEIVGEDDIEVRRPATGLRARYRDAVQGAHARRTITSGEPLNWEDLSWPSSVSE